MSLRSALAKVYLLPTMVGPLPPHNKASPAARNAHASDTVTKDSPVQRKSTENNTTIIDFGAKYSLLTAEPPFELNYNVPTTMNTTEKHGDNTTTTDDNYYDDWNNKKNTVMEHNIMATGANRNGNTATHTNFTSLQNAFISSNRRDQINLTNAATDFTMPEISCPI